LLEQKLDELNRLQAEINDLRSATGTPQQIIVRLQVLEISRTKLRRLETDFASMDGSKVAGKSTRIDSLLPKSGEFDVIGDGDATRAFLDWLQQNNVGRILADPVVATLTGQPVSFRSGGEVPIPGGPGSDQPVEFRQVGTQFDFLANALGNNRVRLDLRVRLCELDESKTISVEGTRLPAFSVRQCDAPIELEFGQTGILAGLGQRRPETVKTDAGIVTEDNEVELLFVVTPEAVSAIASAANKTLR
jgi:pilus assembly protein CpaC